MICEKSTRHEKHARPRETCEKKGRTWYNAKIGYTRFAIQLFSCTIKFYPLSQEKIPLSCAWLPLLPRDGSIRGTREICLMKQHKQHEITHTHLSHLVCFLHFTNFSWIVCSWLKVNKPLHTFHFSYVFVLRTNFACFSWVVCSQL